MSTFSIKSQLGKWASSKLSRNNLDLFKRRLQFFRTIYRGLLNAGGVLGALHGLTQFTRFPSQAQAVNLAVRLGAPMQVPWTDQCEGDKIPLQAVKRYHKPPQPTDISFVPATPTSYTGSKMKGTKEYPSPFADMLPAWQVTLCAHPRAWGGFYVLSVPVINLVDVAKHDFVFSFHVIRNAIFFHKCHVALELFKNTYILLNMFE